MTRESSEAALMRMRDLAMSQTETLQHVRDYVASSLNSSISTRNLILHEDSLIHLRVQRHYDVRSVGRSGFDRIVHFALTNNDSSPTTNSRSESSYRNGIGRSVSYLTQMLER